MAWTTKIDPTDEKFHPRTDDPWWGESSFITFRVPERNLMGMLYHYFRPNQNTFMGGPFIWDDTGADMSTCLFTGWDWHQPIPEGAEMFDHRVDSSFAIETLEPQKRYRYTYDNGIECAYDLVYTAAREPYYQRQVEGTDNEVRQGMYDLVADVSSEDVTTGHYEQYGLMSGSLDINGERVTLTDCVCIKDRSWGPRKVIIPMDKKRVGYPSAVASPDHAFHVWSISDKPWDDDPLTGTSEGIVSGFYVKDGQLGELLTGSRRCLERGEDGRPIREVVEATDTLGRELYAEGESTGCVLRWPGCYGDYMVFISLMKWRFDGLEDVPGEVQDYMQFRTYRRYMVGQRDLEAAMVP
jgi:hypothetical protein